MIVRSTYLPGGLQEWELKEMQLMRFIALIRIAVRRFGITPKSMAHLRRR